jgi:hypothetical protein
MFALIFVLAGLTGYATVWAEPLEKEMSGSQVRIGTFDSRAIAIAYYNTEAHASYIEGLKAKHAKAAAAGDKERAKELEAEGEALQELAHKQGFSTWPVDNILETIKGKLSEIAKQADVDVIVSNWNIVYQRPGVEFIDVTEVMVKLINPDEQILEMLEQLKKQDPVPLEELEKHKH